VPNTTEVTALIFEVAYALSIGTKIVDVRQSSKVTSS